VQRLVTVLLAQDAVAHALTLLLFEQLASHELLPVPDVVFPPEHAVQDDAPELPLYEPVAHGVQDTALSPAEYVPAKHKVQVAEFDPLPLVA
jgi:hypothetical protein